MTEALKSLGYACVMRCRYEDYAELADLLYMPQRDLMLMAHPEAPAILSPAVPWVRERNSISWEAKAGETYILRYRFHPGFVAMQGHTKLPIEPYPVFDDLPLRFMQIRAAHEGVLTVRFVPQWI